MSRTMGVNAAGFYTNPQDDRIVGENSGAKITFLDLRQTGDELQAIDNNGTVWKGFVNENGESFTLTLAVSGSQSVMQGTWIEASILSTFYAEANVAEIQESPGQNIDPSTLDWTGCSSNNGELRLDANGQVQVDANGFALCNNGMSSDSCHVTNSPKNSLLV